MNLPQPSLVAHADWSVAAGKRWLCVAALEDGSYHLHAPEPVGNPATLPGRLLERAADGRAFLGVDFPLGIPVAYAKLCGIDAFPDLLSKLGSDPWHEFLDVCETPEEICLHRPFYPRRPGGTRQQQLYGGLGLDNMDRLRRRCERATGTRAAASPLFWTLGAQQVGRAAIAGWRDLLRPAIGGPDRRIRLWPFEGGLATLITRGAVVVAETYPAESALHIGLAAPGRGWSKRRQSDRAAHAPHINRWAIRRRVTLDEALRPLVRDGFGDVRHGEDQFDALIGVAGMLEVVLGHRAEMPPMSNERRVIEGWILGQGQAPATGK